MIKLIVGNKGAGKTKALIKMVNEAVKSSKGNVICIEKGVKLNYDIDKAVRLIDTEQYAIDNFESYYGFIAGLLAGNYDITDVFGDATFKIGGRDLDAFTCMIGKIEKLAKTAETTVTFTVSCDFAELPENLKAFAVAI